MVEQTMEPSQTKRVPAFTALAKSGVAIWGYRTGDDTSAILETEAEATDTKDAIWYDLQGRRVNKHSIRKSHGLNIVRQRNGNVKKTIMK